MGNCVATNNAIVHSTGTKDEQSSKETSKEIVREKKIVRLRLEKGEEEEEVESNGKAMRIKVVVTQKELMEILSNKSKYSSIEQLLGSVKVKNRRIVHVRAKDRGTTKGWRPALESISE